MKSYILLTADIKIEITFGEEKLDTHIKKIIVEQIQHYYKNLLRKKTNKDTDIQYRIVFRDSNYIKQLNIKKHDFFSEFYTLVDETTYVTYYHISLIQFQLLLHIILQKHMEKTSDFILHASANLVGKSSVLFVGKSGNGKTTIKDMLSNEYPPLADDSIIIHKSGKKYCIFQTPYVEKTLDIAKSDKRIPLGSICFLKKSTQYSRNVMDDKQLIYKTLIQNCIIEDKTSVDSYLKKIQDFTNSFDHFYLVEFGLHQKKLLNLFR